MTEANVLAGELHAAGDDVAGVFSAFVAPGQKGALVFAASSSTP